MVYGVSPLIASVKPEVNGAVNTVLPQEIIEDSHGNDRNV